MRQKRTMPRYSRSQSLSTKQLKLVFMREVIELILRYSWEKEKNNMPNPDHFLLLS